MKKKCEKILSDFTSKDEIFFTNRGNASIRLALQLAQYLGKTKAFIQDQGGWITYEQYLQKLKYEYYLLDTNYGLLDIKYLEKKIDSNSVLLFNSMPGYFCTQENMKEIYALCKKKNCLLINDVSGSIGNNAAKYGDIIIGSFGRWKPINNEYGGFIGIDDNMYLKYLEENFDKELEDFFLDLYKKLSNLDNRLSELKKITVKVKKQLREYDILHKDQEGINVVIKFDSPEKKLDLENYCKAYNYEFTICPRYIRVMIPAISIEIKRM
ncbi:hypothetical protein HN789_02330 [archaeon]|jgi:hypothetical protein|nr:hypothetical protein [archaeon]MBT3720701.1 hypothetical protein [archaeon]MBT4021895.1 hypothetical protein [archaeon]MBT4272190.1 hypothetical protein [archaeon]MBT4461712.1 hypothetical protein [archaeon]